MTPPDEGCPFRTGPFSAWPFSTWHEIAIRRFNLSPREFWNMPLRDWLGLMHGIKGAGFDRADFDHMLKTYPDIGDKNELG